MTGEPQAGPRPTAGPPVSPLISVAELAGLLAAGSPEAAARPTVLDVRWRLGGPPGRELYDAGHIPGAAFVDLDRDLAGPPGPGGRHPLPAAADFERAMRRAGVTAGRPVVVYDDADATAAARAWWLLRYFGHRAVRVLDGGFRAWTAAGQPSGPAGDVPPRGTRCPASTGRFHRPARPAPPARRGRCGVAGPVGAAARRAGGGAVPRRERAGRPRGGSHSRRGQRPDE